MYFNDDVKENSASPSDAVRTTSRICTMPWRLNYNFKASATSPKLTSDIFELSRIASWPEPFVSNAM